MSSTHLRFTLLPKGLVCSPTASFSSLEGDFRITSGASTSQFQEPPQAAEPESGDHYPTGLSSLISLGPPEMLQKNVRPVRTRLKPKWLEERKIYYMSRPAPGSLQKWHWPSSSGLQSFYASKCGSKQPARTKAYMAVSLSLGSYNISY
jgi:hypothetical protein